MFRATGSLFCKRLAVFHGNPSSLHLAAGETCLKRPGSKNRVGHDLSIGFCVQYISTYSAVEGAWKQARTSHGFWDYERLCTILEIGGKKGPLASLPPISQLKNFRLLKELEMCFGEEKKDEEREIWENMSVEAWHNSVAAKESVFYDTYNFTRQDVKRVAEEGHYDVILEVGSGTGDIIGQLDVSIPRLGIDINPDFVGFCQKKYACKDASRSCVFEVGDATALQEWWNKKNFHTMYKKPLVICVNNTLNIMPEEIRGSVVAEMLAVAGESGRCLVTYWNGNFFSHAIMNYYKKNEDLCGPFDMKTAVNWEDRMLVTSTNYSTHWQTPVEVEKLLKAYDVNLNSEDQLYSKGLAIFVWFSVDSTSRAKGYYDSDDAQKFYSNIWGQETIHNGLYHRLTEDDKKMPKQQQIARAQELQEEEFLKQIKAKFPTEGKIRILDMGCGYGGLLRRIWESGFVWSATGCDISVKMCQQADRLNQELGCSKDITILEESYLDTSVADESVDLVISMDALLHVGPNGHKEAIREVARVLRPGGWMIFTDIMQKEQVDQAEMQPIYDRINLSKMGTVSNYKSSLTEAGFDKFEFIANSQNISVHYGTVLEVLEEKGSSLDISEEYISKMKAGLTTWRDLAPKNIDWGFMMAQKLRKVES